MDSYSPVYVLNFGNNLNYNTKIKNIRNLYRLDNLYDKYYYNLIIMFTNLDETEKINFNKLKYGRLFVIINPGYNCAIQNYRECFAERLDLIDKQYLYIINDLHPISFVFDCIKNDLIMCPFYYELYFFIVENLPTFCVKSSNVKPVSVQRPLIERTT